MTTKTERTEAVELHTAVGLIQHAPTREAMLASYNDRGDWYRIDGDSIIHKGTGRVVGIFKVQP